MISDFVGRRGVSLERFRTLCLVAQAGGVMKASGDDPNRQSQYSRQIKELEQGLGVTLLDRSSSPHRLTPAGLEIEREARAFLGEIGRLLDINSGREPVVSIGAGESIIQWLLLPLLARHAALGGMTFRFHNLQSRVAEERVRNHRLDLGVVSLADLPRGLGCEKIASYGMVLIGREAAFRSGRLALGDIAGKRLAVLEGSGRLRQRLAEMAAGMDNPLRVGMECTSYPQVIQACLDGGFVGVVPEIVRASTLHPALRTGKVPELKEMTIDLKLIWHPAAYETRPELRVTVGKLLRR